MKRINWRYALGELLIVTTGIMIAFGLNNWGGELKDRDQKQVYLLSIKEDLLNDIRQLDSNVAEIERRMKYLERLRPHLYGRLPKRDSMAMGIFKATDPVSFRPQDHTIQSLQFSGDLKLISDLELKNRIMAHYSLYEEVELESERHINFAKDYMAKYYMTEIDYTKFRTGEGAAFMDDPYFHNLVFALSGIYVIEHKAQRKALESARAMVELL